MRRRFMSHKKIADEELDYLTIIPEGNSDVTIHFHPNTAYYYDIDEDDDIYYACPFSYRIDDGEWILVDEEFTWNQTVEYTIPAGSKFQIKANLYNFIENLAYDGLEPAFITNNDSEGFFSVEGTPMSLLDENIPRNFTQELYTQHFYFKQCLGLRRINNPKTFLPATTLTNYCYAILFYHCSNLTNAPELPATTLTIYCYNSMFNGCSSLTNAPELPATTLGRYCYDAMFGSCTSLTTAPELPATILIDGCYISMFNNCSNLNYIKMLATDVSAQYCLDSWVGGVSSTGTFIKHPDMTSLPTGRNGIPEGWTVVNDGE